jgi:hypothetical protein
MGIKTQKIWVAINKNGEIRMFTDEPKRNVKTGKWESSRPFVNSHLFNEVKSILEHAMVTWESEPNFFEIQVNSND